MTPALHRVHHSVAYDENNSNFSNLLTIWDRMFGTLRPEARATLRVGLADFASDKFQRLDRMLVLPWLVTPVRP
jgi:sterol desaturase/sphingolipid hydroxylase (fatty acid hydroxylase superfamily)